MKKKGFTLIELIAVLVIMAIIALIVTPLVLNIINKAKDSANKRSVDAYGRSIELAIATYMMDNKIYPNSIDELTIEYSGNEVECKTKEINEDGSIYLSECSVDKKEVKDAKEKDGYYHYGKKVSKYDYKIGDKITYNGMEFYVIKNSLKTEDYVTLLKAEPLTVDEVNTYEVGHVNRYTNESQGTVYNRNGYGGMAYYSSETCGYPNGPEYSSVYTDCTTNYDASDIKYVVDAWANDKLKLSDLKEDSLGYKVRLITLDDLTGNLGIKLNRNNATSLRLQQEDTPVWIFNVNFAYWTMTSNTDEDNHIWIIDTGVGVYSSWGVNAQVVVRPVINLLKTATN